MIHALDYPALLDRHEAAARRESELDDLYRQQVAIERRRVEALDAMRAATRAGDDDAWDRAAAEHDECSDELGPIRDAILDIEGRGARTYERQVRSDYYNSLL